MNAEKIVLSHIHAFSKAKRANGEMVLRCLCGKIIAAPVLVCQACAREIKANRRPTDCLWTVKTSTGKQRVCADCYELITGKMPLGLQELNAERAR